MPKIRQKTHLSTHMTLSQGKNKYEILQIFTTKVRMRIAGLGKHSPWELDQIELLRR